MRKHIAALLSIILIITLACSATLCFVNATDFQEVNPSLSPSVITPDSNYMQLASPKHVSHSADTLIVANDRELFINTDGGKYITVHTIADRSILQIAANKEHIAILSYDKSTDTNLLDIINASSGEHIKAFDTNVFPKEPSLIAADSNGIYALDSSNNLFHIMDINIVPTTPILSGRATTFSRLLAAQNDAIYLYRQKTSNAPLAIYEYSDTLEKEILASESITSFSVSADGVFYTTGTKTKDGKITDAKLGYHSNGSTTEMVSFDNEVYNISAIGNTVYAASPNNNRVLIYNYNADTNTLEPKGYYGDKGNELGRLNSPTSLSILGKDVIVADSVNSRIIATDTTTNINRVLLGELDHTISLIASSGNQLVTVDSGMILRRYELKDNALSFIESLPMSSYTAITDIALTSSGTAYLLAAGGNVLKVSGNMITAFHQDSKIMALSLSRDNYLYAAATDKLLRFNLDTSVLDNTYQLPVAIIDDFFVDFAGNAFYLSGNIISRYVRRSMQYSPTQSSEITSISSDISLIYDRLSGDCYIADKLAHKLLSIDTALLGTMSESNMDYTHPSQDLWTIVTAGTIAEDGYLLSAPNNNEAITKVYAGSIFLSLASVTYEQIEYYYGVLDGNDKEFFYIEKSKVAQHNKLTYPDSHELMSPMYISGAKIYTFPFHSATVTFTAPKGSSIKLIDNVAYSAEGVHMWKWYKVSCTVTDGTTAIGYAHSSDIYYSGISTPPKNKKYLVVSSEKFGMPISMYREPSDTSEVLFGDISDGDKVMLAQDSFNSADTFTRVTHKNVTGYIKTIYLKASGLTGSQQLALIVSAACLAVLLIIILLIFLRRKIKPNGKDHDALANYDVPFNSNSQQ